ncbi:MULTISPECIES: peptidoglycan-binding domain-containing protein [Thermoanaerobacterium]|uniref:Peptidoglycan-binding domain 1 protein n=2 Tax=Thermoanaerobacterium TaxID=28895 RepID=W9EA11_9THEO|nr:MULTISPECIES: peptidoglycan-binding domain-containing protein [Thermoanaerobacterium]AFK87380.1 Peptidoglycan-binding domain 1 protein [Thermoanaerobacterium saccharolyticum JW/SL-YS485]ETO38843.1 peptidoglycan-binding domain 1 protein [Thermoanaerobacterium aotearoense SCUT27]
MKLLKKSTLFITLVLSIIILFSISSFAQNYQSNNIKDSKYIAYAYNDKGAVEEKKVVSTIQEGNNWIKSKGIRGIICLKNNSKTVAGIELEGIAIDFTSNQKYVINMKYYKNKYDKKVLALQKILNYLGFKLKEDGYYGENTYYAVKKFQAKEHLTVDGIVGKNTLECLACAAKIKS